MMLSFGHDTVCIEPGWSVPYLAQTNLFEFSLQFGIWLMET
jgi:hypothetical protein